jgi:hypothetical protein
VDWKALVQNAGQYGFLGPIVGIAGLFIGASIAILFGWTRTFDAWKPPADVLPEPLSRMVTVLCSVGLFLAWILAEPGNQSAYIRAVIWLAAGATVAFLIYVGLRGYCGRFRKPIVGPGNRPAGEEVVWGGFWLKRAARRQARKGASVEDILAGNLYKKSAVWPPLSLVTAAVVTALVLLGALVCATSAISTLAATAQVVLTKKPAREVFGTADVPGLSPSKSPPASREPRKAEDRTDRR